MFCHAVYWMRSVVAATAAPRIHAINTIKVFRENDGAGSDPRAYFYRERSLFLRNALAYFA